MKASLATAICFGVICGFVACNENIKETPGSDPAINKYWHEEPRNLASILNGAVVVDRSAEMSFEHSTINAVDGAATTGWMSPARSIDQWMIVQLPGLARIDAIGVATEGVGEKEGRLVKEMQVEFSEDGENFDDAGVFSFEREGKAQLHDLTPRLARFVRVSVLANHGNEYFFGLATLLVQGELVDEYIERSAAGRWQLNDLEAFFKQEENRVYGHDAMDPPMLIDGAWDGRAVRFSWVRGRSYGTGIFSVNSEMTTLSGQWWYEHWVDPGNAFGAPWFGTKLGEVTREIRLDTSQVAQLHIERDGTFPLFGLVYDADGSFDSERSQKAIEFVRVALDTFSEYKVRLIVREYSQRDERDNMTLSESKAVSLLNGLVEAGLPEERLVIDADGSKRFVPLHDAPIHWKMYSRVDFALTGL